MLAAQDMTREKFEEDARSSAEDSVRTQLFLDAVADKEQPEVSQEELMDHIAFTANQYGMDPNQFIMQLQQAGQLGSLFADVRRGKALALNIARTSVKDTDGADVDPKEYFGDVEAEDKADKAEADKADKAEEKPKKAPAKKSTTKKSTAKKSTAKKSTAKKSTAKKSTTKKSTAKKSTAKKSTAKKSTAKKSTAKKAAKSTAKKSTAKKTAKKAAEKKED